MASDDCPYFVLIVQFDKRLVAQYKRLNIADNKVSQSVFDILSNIITVIILRVERVVSSALYEKVFQPLQLLHGIVKLMK